MCNFHLGLCFLFFVFCKTAPVMVCVERYENSETFVLQLVVIFEERKKIPALKAVQRFFPS